MQLVYCYGQFLYSSGLIKGYSINWKYCQPVCEREVGVWVVTMLPVTLLAGAPATVRVGAVPGVLAAPVSLRTPSTSALGQRLHGKHNRIRNTQ